MTRVAKRVENEYRAALQTESMLRDQFDQQKVEAYKLNDTAAQYSIMRGEVDASRELYNDVQIKLKEAGITAGLSSTNVTILDVARTPVKPVVPNVKVALLTGLSVGLVLGIIVAFFRESLNDTINSVEQLEEASSLPVIALVPNRLEDKGSSTTIVGGSSLMSPVILGMPQSKSAEAYRGLRTCILLYSVDQPPNVIAITSSIPQEGKTTTSVNMAIALAQRGAKVLLVDADLRRPSVHKYFAGSRPKRGLTSLLSGDASMEDVCLPADEATPGLTVIPSGPLTPYPSEMLSSSRFRDSLNTWRQSFDHIVIDTPPITAVTDPVIIAQYADAVVLVARAGFVTKPALSRSINLLIRAQIKIAGIVLNRVDIATEYYYYGSGYYGYGRKKGSADAYYTT
jgi:capsular exopolysaccharide synthesis family protein